MSLRLSEPIEQRPQVTLSEWTVFEVPSDGRGRPWTRHLVGWSCETRRGRVCSPVVALDAESATCMTASGRVYRLFGAPGLCPEGHHVLHEWLRVHGLKELRDVTADVFLAIEDARDRKRVVH